MIPDVSARLEAAPAHVAGGVLASVPIAHAPSDGDVDRVDWLDGLVSHGALHPDERVLAGALSGARRAGFVAGRVALRAALAAVDPAGASAPLLRHARGRPLVPPTAAGSVSHKRTRAVALAAPRVAAFGADADDAEYVGIDLEERPVAGDADRPSIASRILTPREQDDLARAVRGDALAHRDATLLRFALKEAIYKAIDPWVERYVRFTEVELVVDDHAQGGTRDEGDAQVALLLPEGRDRPLIVTAAWRRDARWIVATARSSRR